MSQVRGSRCFRKEIRRTFLLKKNSFILHIDFQPLNFANHNSSGGRFYLTIRAHVPTGLQDSSEVIENEELSGFLKDLLELVKKVQSCDI